MRYFAHINNLERGLVITILDLGTHFVSRLKTSPAFRDRFQVK